MCIRKYNCLSTFGHLTFRCKGPIVGGLKQWHEIQPILSCAAPGTKSLAFEWIRNHFQTKVRAMALSYKILNDLGDDAYWIPLPL